jgi:hypothetical protein
VIELRKWFVTVMIAQAHHVEGMLQGVAQLVLLGHSVDRAKFVDGDQAASAGITAAGGFTQTEKSLLSSDVDIDEEAWLMKTAGECFRQGVGNS